MKISIIDHVGCKAGMDYYSTSLAKGLQENGIDCIIFSNFENKKFSKIKYKPYFEGFPKKKSIFKLFRYLTAIIKSSLIAKKESSNIVMVHLFSSNLISFPLVLIPKLFNLKVAIIAHDILSFSDKDNKLIQWLIYNYLSNFIIVHNNYSYNTLLNQVKIKKTNKIFIIPHGGYLDHISIKLSKKEARKKLGLKKDGKYILFFGQIKKIKGLDILLRAMYLLPQDINLIIAGKPWKDDFSHYENLINKYNLNNRVFKMIRFISDEERELLFTAADVNVIPYRIIYQSGVLLMSMSYGLPVIASNLPAIREVIIDQKNGLLFEKEDPISLAKKILLFFNNEEFQTKLSKNAVKTIKNDYSWKNIAKKYIEIINNL